MTEDSLTRAHERIGDVLNDKWTLERLLGVGGMGAVYAGRHRNGARAAVKVLHPHLAAHQEVRERFLREGYAANRVEHPCVVKVLDDDIVRSGPDDGTAYLVMELLEGESLESRSNRGLQITERELLALSQVVLEMLEVAHANGVVHRDIKPDNVFITTEGTGTERVKVLDFGLARLLEGHSKTVHGLAVGTPSFMSPEQAAGRNGEIDGRTDLFALGAMGFRLLTGQRIHEAPSTLELVGKMATLPAPLIRTVRPEVSESLARVIDRALEFRREDRYESAAAMRVDVEKALAALDLVGPPTLASELRAEKSVELSTGDLEVVVPPAEDAVKTQEVPALDTSSPPAASVRPSTPEAPSTLPSLAEVIPVPLPTSEAAPTVTSAMATVRIQVQSPPGTVAVPTEESLSPLPRERPPFALAAAALLIVGVGVSATFAARWLTDPSSSNTEPSLRPVEVDAATLDATSDGSLEAAVDAPVTAETGIATAPAHRAPPKPRPSPAPTSKGGFVWPWKAAPPKKAKH